jgi:hypothetical protein
VTRRLHVPLCRVNPYLAMVGLVAAIAGMYFQRTRSAGRPTQNQPAESVYKAGYEG